MAPASSSIEATPTRVRVTERVLGDPRAGGAGRPLLAREGEEMSAADARDRGIPEDLFEPVAWARATGSAPTTGDEPSTPDGTPDKSWTNAQLRAELGARGLPVSGNKAELLERLAEGRQSSDDVQPPSDPTAAANDDPTPEANGDDDEADEAAPVAAFPKESGGGWFELSDGTKVRGEEEAVEAQAALDASPEE